jgi:hypothetical protein
MLVLQFCTYPGMPPITKETTMWRCWVGFNASHSIGLILFGLVFGFLALAHGQLLFQSPFLLVVGLAMETVHDHINMQQSHAQSRRACVEVINVRNRVIIQ